MKQLIDRKQNKVASAFQALRMPVALRNKMALMTRLKSSEASTNDITSHLRSLQFESVLTEEEKQLLHLRAKSHALSVYQCAQATYFSNVLHQLRELKSQLKNPSVKRTTRILQNDRSNKDPLLVGILGCGRLGSQIVQCLLTYGKISPANIQISTRRPEILDHFQQQGVDCYCDNIKLVSSVHVIFFCVLPSQLTAVAEEVKSHIQPSTIAFVFTSGISLRRLKQMLNTSSILSPEFTFPERNHDKDWNYHTSISMALENKSIVEKTCPISNTANQLVQVNPNLAVAMVYAFVNMCSEQGLTKQETLQAVHMTVFGENEQSPSEDKLTVTDFGGRGNMSECFPFFDLIEIYENESYVMQKLQKSKHLQQTFIKQYWRVFEEYLHAQFYGHLE